MNLNERMERFLGFLKSHALEGFGEMAKDRYTTDYRVIWEELEYLGHEMKRALSRQDQEHYTLCETHYLEYFKMINTEIAKEDYTNEVDKFSNKGHSQLDAERNALELLWSDYRYEYWLPAQARMSHQDGRQVFLIANEMHIPQEGLYVTLSEVEDLVKSGRDPWEYVSTRKALEEAS